MYKKMHINPLVPPEVKSSRFSNVHAWTFFAFYPLNEGLALDEFFRSSYQYDRKRFFYRIRLISKLLNQTLILEPRKTKGRFDPKKIFFDFFMIFLNFFFKISFTFEYQQEDEMILVIFFYFLHFTHTICVNFSEWTEQIYFLQREHLIRVRFFLPFSQISHTTLRDGVIL